MTTITNTGNFMARPNVAREFGIACTYHFHNFDHTVLPLSGLWRVTAYDHTGDDNFGPSRASFIGSIYIAPHLFAAARPDLEAKPWALIRKGRWHQIELVSKTLLAGGQRIDTEECQFWCCWSYRMPSGEVVEYNTGWEGTVS